MHSSSSNVTSDSPSHEHRRRKKKVMNKHHMDNIHHDYRSNFSGAGGNDDSMAAAAAAAVAAKRRCRRDTERLTDSDNDDEAPSQSNDDSIARLASERLADIRENFIEELSETNVVPSAAAAAAAAAKKRRHDSNEEKLSDDDSDADEDADEVGHKKARFDSSVHQGAPSLSDDQQQQKWQPKSDDRGAALLAKMGYGGGGLGKSGQGRVDPIPLSTQRGRIGLGHQANQVLSRDLSTQWDSSSEEKSAEERPLWLQIDDEEKRSSIISQICDDWMVVGERKERIDDEDQYCDRELLLAMLNAKSVFDDLSDRDLREARSRANPYETIGSVFFQNRAAMKVANLDCIFDWKITNENPANLERKNPVEVRHMSDGRIVAKEGENTDRKAPLFYFADVCAGPGGFTEYVLWRKAFYNAKGFGFTLTGKDDFKLERFMAACPQYFEPYYGKHGDGDVMKPDNIISLREVVMKGTNNVGVDLMMADGGFSVEGKENIQEILSKRLYLCQFLVALSLVRSATESREGGIFFCKLFDIFTPFSVGLVYLMYLAFKRISLHKPNTSRPANSERYIICENLTPDGAEKVRDYLTAINDRMAEMEQDKATSKTKDINEVVPADIIQSDEEFMRYVVSHNESVVKRQTQYLDKYRSFAKNAGLIDVDQGKLREQCLEYWRIPDVPKRRQPDESLETSIARLCQVVDFEQLRRRAQPFTESVLHSHNESRMRCAELRMCAITEKEPPTLLFSVRMGIFIRSPSSISGFEKLDIMPRIPKDTVLFVHKTTAYGKLNEQGKPDDSRSVIRVIDGAVLNGDDISALTYDERIAAITKLCNAVNCVTECQTVVNNNNNNNNNWSRRSKQRIMAPAHRMLPAKVFKLDEIGNERERFKVTRWKGEELAIIEEGDYKFVCRGMRIISLLAEPWVMCWSKSQHKPYAYDKTGRNAAVFIEQFVEKHCCTNFWRTIIPKKATATKPEENYQWYWDWAEDFLDGHGYGPNAILGDEEHQGGPTWRLVSRIAIEQRDKICS